MPPSPSPSSTAAPTLSVAPATATASITTTTVATPAPSATGYPSHTPTPTACTVQFRDVPTGSTYFDYVLCLACRGIVSGYADGTFRPNNLTTRGQVCKIDILAAGITLPVPQDRQTFADIPPGSTFWLYVERAYGSGLVSGYRCGASPGEPCNSTGRPYFRPNGPATRGQIAKIVDRTAGFAEPPAGQMFEDVPPGSSFYTDVQRLAIRNIISGYACGSPEPCIPPSGRPYYRPGGSATRGQLAKILARALNVDCVTP